MIDEIFLLVTCFSSFCLVEIGDMMGRSFRYNYEEPSELKVACFEARKLVVDRKVIVLMQNEKNKSFNLICIV